jgi:hypothetical protein
MRTAVLLFAGLIVVAAPGVAHAGDGTSLLPLVDDDAQVVGVIDVADAHDAPIYAALMKKVAELGGDRLVRLEQLGVDLDKDVDTLLIAGSEDQSAAGRIVILEGRFASVDTALADVTTKKHRGVTYHAVDQAEIAVIGKRLVITDAGQMDAVIDRAKKKSKSSLTRSPKAAGLRAAIALTDTRQDIWMAASEMSMGGVTVTAMSIGMALGDDAVIQAKIQAADAATASSWVTMVAGYMDQVRGWLGGVGLTGLGTSLAVSAEADVIEVDATLPGAELDSLVGLSSFL